MLRIGDCVLWQPATPPIGKALSRFYARTRCRSEFRSELNKDGLLGNKEAQV